MDNTGVCCGAVIPEVYMVCWKCEKTQAGSKLEKDFNRRY